MKYTQEEIDSKLKTLNKILKDHKKKRNELNSHIADLSKVVAYWGSVSEKKIKQ